MPAAKKTNAPEAKTVRLQATINTKAAAQTDGPTYWAFERHGAAAFVGVGTEPQASTYVRLLNHGRALDHLTVRPVTAAEAEALEAAGLAAPVFNIVKEMPRIHLAQPRFEEQP